MTKEMIMSLRSISFKRWCHVFVCFSYATHRRPCLNFNFINTFQNHIFQVLIFSLVTNEATKSGSTSNAHDGLPSPATPWFRKPHSNLALAPLRGYQALLLMKLPRPAPLVIFTMGYQVRPHCGFRKSTQRATKSGYFAGFHLLSLGYQVRPQCSFKNLLPIPIISFTHTLGVMFLHSQFLCLVYMHRLRGKTFHAFKVILKLN
jgi:hypothetical protein